jgi:tRNA-dihydrouridine synthase
MDWKGQHLGIVETRRHYTNYFKGLPNFKEYRTQMVTSEDPEYIFETFNTVLEKFSGMEIL